MAGLSNEAYGWVICAMACWISSSFGTSNYTFSIIIGPLVKEFDSSLVTMSVGWECIDALMFLMAPICAVVGKSLGHRRALAISCILAFTSVASSVLVKSDWQFIVLYCILPGMCFSMMNICTILIFITYFDEKLGIANGFYKGCQRLGSVLHSVPINYLALHYGHEYNSMYMAALFLVCLSLMAFFYPNPVEKESSLSGGCSSSYQPIEHKRYSVWARGFFYTHILFYWIGFTMVYGYIVELVELQAVRQITTFERGLIVLTHSLATGTYCILAPIIAHGFAIAPQLMVAAHLLVNILVLMFFTIATNFYCLLALVGVFGICNATQPAFAAPTSLGLHPSKSPELAIALTYIQA